MVVEALLVMAVVMVAVEVAVVLGAPCQKGLEDTFFRFIVFS